MRTRAWLAIGAMLLGGCSDTEPAAGGGPGGGGGGGSAGSGGGAGAAGDPGVDESVVDAPLALDCDPIVPQHCGFPFPNDTWTVADAASPTGRRLALRDAMLPRTLKGVRPSPADYADSDGFSPGVALLAHLPGATTQGLPTPLTIADSLLTTSPTVLLDAATGERIPHFSELDVAGDPEEQSFMIRPAVRLKDATRYIVAIRRVVDASGAEIAPSEAFRALRDRLPSTDPAVAGRRGRFGAIFRSLDQAGVARPGLQLAWDFTTASRAGNTAAMVSIRDQALAAVGASGPTYVIDEATKDPKDTLAVRLRGRFKVPLFLDQPGPGARTSLGPDGQPRQNGEAEFPFVALVPKVAESGEPAAVVWYGHGQLGSHEEAEAFDDLANAGRFALVASDWSGMAAEDADHLIEVITSGQLGRFRTIVDRLQQGVVNALLLTRMATGRLADDPAVQLGGRSALRRQEPYYFGASQGGIFGASYMALTTDVARGVLDVPGQSYNLLLQRSKNFDPFFAILRGTYPSMFDIQMVLQLIQLHWDRAEPTGYSSYVRDNRLPGTPPHEVLLITSIGDHQVTTLGAHVMARAIGVKNLAPLNRPIFGLEAVESPYAGSALLEIGFGLPPEPLTNVPMKNGQDPHGSLGNLPEAAAIIGTFLRQGQVTGCGGPCQAAP